MANRDPNQPGQSPPPDDPLTELRERLARTQEAAERLAEAATGARRSPPPAGWQAPRDPGDSELRAVATLADALRGLVPADLQEQIGALVRELLLAIRALIDYLVDRLERRRSTPVEVEDIPIG
jgi:poly-gamma-glutamate capsule biosynthesis protein CapA/YwtB (metallophosphatase superfamily)